MEHQQEVNPSMQIENQFANVHFGGLLSFEVRANNNVPLPILTTNCISANRKSQRRLSHEGK